MSVETHPTDPSDRETAEEGVEQTLEKKVRKSIEIGSPRMSRPQQKVKPKLVTPSPDLDPGKVRKQRAEAICHVLPGSVIRRRQRHS
ncbi:unnamed protein product [Nezara viridula]|uniref:Uncharacterized protein n=1 Tax=Nezara viridula TaxID=85310 RepID=A0A9P0HKE3_NEZVI|nr:unnamed protein product [Nezara viridula]